MDTKKPLPLEIGPVRAHCAVCGKTVYSAAGIHPQCAMSRASAKVDATVALQSAAAKTEKRVDRPWSKPCPKCRRELHVRRAVCDCGHSFLAARTV